MFKLPTDWYPPTLVVPTSVHQSYRDSAPIDQLLPDEILDRGTRALRATVILARSSAQHEDINERGRYDSARCEPTPGSLRSAVELVYASGQDKSSSLLAVLFQPFITAELSGHLSNEYRVSRESNIWTLEEKRGNSSEEKQIRAARREASTGPLLCPSPGALETGLRAVAGRLASAAYRYHLEWVWDGRRLWIVQADKVSPFAGPAPGDLRQPRVGRVPAVGELKYWRRSDSLFEDRESAADARRFPKLRNLEQFSKAGLPVPHLWVLSGDCVVSEVEDDFGPTSDFIEDLALLTAGDLIVRTDVANEFGSEILLPKTDNCAEPNSLRKFLVDTSQSLIERGVVASNVAFLAHRYMRARASAWTYARPDEPQVMVDSTWGVADGLSWCPHDTAYVDPKSDDIQRLVTAKTVFFDVGETRDWIFREAPTEWIWRASASDGQLRTMAAAARRLADLRGQPTATMWFVNLLDGAETDCLAWFSTEYEVDPLTEIPRIPKWQQESDS